MEIVVPVKPSNEVTMEVVMPVKPSNEEAMEVVVPVKPSNEEAMELVAAAKPSNEEAKEVVVTVEEHRALQAKPSNEDASKSSDEAMIDVELHVAKAKASDEEAILLYPFIGGYVIEDAAKGLFLGEDPNTSQQHTCCH